MADADIGNHFFTLSVKSPAYSPQQTYALKLSILACVVSNFQFTPPLAPKVPIADFNYVINSAQVDLNFSYV